MQDMLCSPVYCPADGLKTLLCSLRMGWLSASPLHVVCCSTAMSRIVAPV